MKLIRRRCKLIPIHPISHDNRCLNSFYRTDAIVNIWPWQSYAAA